MEYLVHHFTSKSVIFVIGAAWGWAALAYPMLCVQNNWRTLIPVLWLDKVAVAGAAALIGVIANSWAVVGFLWAAIAIVAGFFLALAAALLFGAKNGDIVLFGGVLAFGGFLATKLV